MKRYFNEKSEDDDEDKNIFDGNNDDGDEGDDEGEHEGGIIIDMDFEDVAMQIDLMHTQLKERLMTQAREIARQDIWWWFRTPARKTKVINKIFKNLVKVIYEDEETKKG